MGIGLDMNGINFEFVGEPDDEQMKAADAGVAPMPEPDNAPENP